MIERLLITAVLALLASGIFWGVRQWHTQRITRVSKPDSQPVLLYFRSDTCAMCETQWRYLEQLSQTENGRIRIQKIDTDQHPEEAARYGVFTLPTTILLTPDGTVQTINYGLTTPKKLAQQLAMAQHLA